MLILMTFFSLLLTLFGCLGNTRSLATSPAPFIVGICEQNKSVFINKLSIAPDTDLILFAGDIPLSW